MRRLLPLLLAGLLASAHAATVRVMPGASLQQAIRMAKPGDVLDSGLRPAKLPSDLVAKLPHLPAPYTRYTLGADVLLVNRDTHAILDVIPQIAR